jgi:hypothetical protein
MTGGIAVIESGPATVDNDGRGIGRDVVPRGEVGAPESVVPKTEVPETAGFGRYTRVYLYS